MDHGRCSRRMVEGHSWQRLPSQKWAKAEKKTDRKSSAVPHRQPAGPRESTIVEEFSASDRWWATSLAGSRPSSLQGGTGRQSHSPFERGVAARAISVDSGVHCSGPKACGGHAHRRVVQAQETLRHDEALWAQNWRSECAKELTEAALWLQTLRAEAEEMIVEPAAPQDWEAEVRRLRQHRIAVSKATVRPSVEAAQMVQERAAKQRACAECLEQSKHSQSGCTKHLEHRDAFEIGDASVVAELSNSWPQGAVKT